MPSTVIRSFSYDEETASLIIVFNSGRRYCYAKVPSELAKAFRLAFSKGEFFNRYIRDRFSFTPLA